jgi:acetyl-CoA/propionyl-CoA carboxylase biotin carboxyl carrier protein
MATVLPFHRAVVRDPAYVSEPFEVHTRWIETEWVNTVEPHTPSTVDGVSPDERTTVVVEVGGKRLEVSLPAGVGQAAGPGPAAASAKRRAGHRKAAAGASGDALTAPMQGTIVKIAVADGDTVAEGDLVVVLEAMKMEQPISAHKAGTVSGLAANVGDVVQAGTTICEIR